MVNLANQNGQTSVALSQDLVNALGALNVQAQGFGSTKIRNGVANFLVTGGAVDLDTTKVEVLHSGGLTFKSGSTEVSLTDFAITNLGSGTVLTGLVTVNGNLVTRAPLFDLQIGTVGTSRRRGRANLDINNVKVTLTDGAAGVLNQAFGVSAFTPGFNIGTAQVDAFFSRSTGNLSEQRLPVLNAKNNASLFPEATQDVLPQGKTSVDFSDGFVDALGSLKVRASGFGSTKIKNGVADFLITGGATDLDTTKVEILHAGGLTLKAGQTKVNLTDFSISNLGDQTVLTGAVTVNNNLVGRVSLFDLEIGSVATSAARKRTNLDLKDVNVSLTSGAADTLNQVFGVSAFTAGFNIGTAQVDAFVS
ncbi:MAG: hypothetical protein HC772_10520 [Leptolyngbyaceae cyanobacterium CRU_2_3]|nr:hypothetical protein [Leptolyngbyaceae cyanobacterium CRU_2_3]